MFTTKRDLDTLFKDYAVQENIDILHRILIEAKERKSKGDAGKDVWQEDLEPRAAVCARTVPILEQEAKSLRESLAAVCGHTHDCIPYLTILCTMPDGGREHTSTGPDRGERKSY